MTQPKQIPNVTDERLCWLAVREQVGKKARKPGLLGWLQVLGTIMGGGQGARIGGDMRREAAASKMTHYTFAVDDAARALTAEERQHLRSTGEVPDWFLADVERRAAERR
ncbi:hypothetical protein ACFQ1I_26505 [Kitasatospora arboriphila]